MSETASSLQPSPYSQPNNGAKLSPSNTIKSENMHGHERESEHEHLQGSDFSNSNSNVSHPGANEVNNNGMKIAQPKVEGRQGNHSMDQTNQSQSQSSLNNLNKSQAPSKALSSSNEELPRRMLLFSPSPDKGTSSHHNRSTGGNNHGHSHHYDRDTSNGSVAGNTNVGANKINESNNGSRQHPPSGPGGSGGIISSPPSNANKHSSANSTNIGPSNNAHSHTHDRHSVSNQTSSLYGHHDRDSYGGGGRHSSTYSSHAGGGGRRYGNGYDDYQLHSHHDHHHNQRHPSNDDYYDSHHNTGISRHTGSVENTQGPLDPGLPTSTSAGGGGVGGGGSYSRGMHDSRLAYEQDLHNSNNNNSHHHSHHHPQPASYGSDRRKEEMKHYNPPQASPAPYDRYGHRPTRFEMDHRRLPLMDIGGGSNGDQRMNGGSAGGACNSSNSGATAIGLGGGHLMDEDKNHGYEGRSGGYHVSPAVAISRRGGTKRSPYEQSDHIFSNDHNSHPSPPNIRNTSAVRYCTPIVTGSERNRLDNNKLPQGSQGHDDLGGYGRSMNTNGPSPPSSRYDDNHDSHLRHYHRPYPCIRDATSSPPRYGDGSPHHHHHSQRGSPSHYATPVLMRNNSIRDRSYYDAPHPHMQSSYHHREKENYSYPQTGYSHPSTGFYSPYGNTMAGGPGGARRHLGHGHPDYHHPNSLHHSQQTNSNNYNNAKNIDSTAPPPQKKQRRNNVDSDKSKTKSKAAVKPPRRKKMYSDYVGVTYNKTHAKFQACITHYRKQHYLGRYKLAVDAARAYDKSAKELKGEGWKINFQADEDYEQAKLKEIAETEKKRKAAAAKLLQEQEDSKLPSSGDQQASSVSFSSHTDAKLSSNVKSEDLSSDTPKHTEQSVIDETTRDTTESTEQKSNASHPSLSSDKVESTCISKISNNALSSAVTPSPHAQNLNKMNQASLMNEPLISPLPKVSNMNTPLVQKSVFSPTPLKQSASQSGNNTKTETELNDTAISSGNNSDMPIMTSNIFSSPLEKQGSSITATVTETKKGISIQESSIKAEDEEGNTDAVTSAKQAEGKIPKVQEAENAAQALLMIRL